MDLAAWERVAENSKTLAEKYIIFQLYGRAFAHLLVALKINPSWKDEMKPTFVKVLREWCAKLEREERYNDMFTCFEQAIEVCPEYEDVYKLLGDTLLRHGSPKEATNYLRKYIKMSDWDITYIHKLEVTCNRIVEQWHFRMLNDEHRNESFREAIVKKVRLGYDTVLDIGTGTGLLSLFAVEGGSNSVYACDTSSVMVDITTEIMKQHDFPFVKVIKKHSTDLRIPEDLDERVKLIVCEIVDSGLLGEHVLQTLIHAHDHLLHPYGVVLPQKAEFHLCGIHAPRIAKTWFLTHYPRDFGLDEFIISAVGEDYDTEDLKLLKEGYTIVTDVVTPFTVDFNNPLDMEAILAGEKDCTVTLSCEKNLDVHCIAGWFTLKVDEEIVFNTSPGSDVHCWDQAIFPLHCSLPSTQNSKIDLFVSCKLGKLTLATVPKVAENQLNASQSVIKMLNDVKYLEVLDSATKMLCDTRKSACHILDTSPFPYLGLRFLRNRRQFGDKLLCLYQTEDDKDLIKRISLHLEVEQQVLCVSEEAIQSFIDSSQKFDVILIAAVEESGLLAQKYLSKLLELRKCLKPGGIFLPHEISIKGQLVECEYLKNTSRVINSNVTCGYLIAPTINMFKVDLSVDISAASLEYTERTEEITLLKARFDELASELKCTTTAVITTPGRVSAIVYWFNLNFSLPNCNYCTKDSDIYFNQGAFIMDFKTKRSVELETKYSQGIFRTRVKPKK